jgi:hypothetical protein
MSSENSPKTLAQNNASLVGIGGAMTSIGYFALNLKNWS